LDFLNKCRARIEDIVKILGYATKPFEIMKAFDNSISEEEKENLFDGRISGAAESGARIESSSASDHHRATCREPENWHREQHRGS
jgi:hypothetical protein